MVPPDSPLLIDRTGKQCVATTDPNTQCIYLSDQLTGDFLKTVLLHEMGHCVMLSYGLILAIRSRLPKNLWIEAEEWCCNLIADYGEEILEKTDRILSTLKKERISKEKVKVVN